MNLVKVLKAYKEQNQLTYNQLSMTLCIDQDSLLKFMTGKRRFSPGALLKILHWLVYE